MLTTEYDKLKNLSCNRLIGNCSGHVFVSTIFIIFIIFTLTTAVTTLVNSQARSAIFMRDRNAAFYLAESGINEAIYRIKELDDADNFNSDDHPSLLGDNSFYDVTIEQDDSIYTITSTGIKNERKRVIKYKIKRASDDGGIFPINYYNTQGIITTDISNPDSPEDPVNDYYAPDYEYFELPFDMPDLLPPPSGVLNMGPLELNNNHTINPGNYQYDYIQLNKNSSLTINGPANIYTSSIQLLQGADLTVNGEVNFYITGDFMSGKNSILTVNGTSDFNIGNSMALTEANLVFNGETTFKIQNDLDINTVSKITQNARVNFIINGDLLIDKSHIGHEGTPSENLIFFFPTDVPHDIGIYDSPNVSAGIYAPTGDTTIGVNSHFIGAITTETLNLYTDINKVIYDENMVDITLDGYSSGDLESSWEFISWEELS